MLDAMMKISLTLVAVDKMSRVIRDVVSKSNSEFERLQNKISQTSERLDKLGKDMAKTGAVLTASGGLLAHKLGITQAIPEALEMEHRLRELGNIGELSAQQLADMDKRLANISRHTNQMRPEIMEGLNVLVASGIAPEKALDYMNVIGRTATGEQAAIIDISKTAFAVTDNLKVPVAKLGKTMDILAMSGKEGRFELKDMAAAFPSLTAGASMLGMRGVPAVASLGAALQVAMKGAGEASEAANNLENFIQRVTSPHVVKRFEETFGVDIKKILVDAASAGKDPILEVLELVNNLSGGDIFKVSEVFHDKSVLNFIKPMLQNLDEYKRIKASALGADGVIESDFNNMMSTTIEQFKQLKINMKELVFPNLHTPLEKVNKIIKTINSHPLLQKGIFTAIIGTIGTGVVLTVLGTATMLVGKFVSGYGKLLQISRDLAPVLKNGTARLLEFIGLKLTAFRFENNRGSVFGGFLKDIDKLNSNMKRDIAWGFKSLRDSFVSLPSNIANSSVALKNWTITSFKAIPGNFMNGLNALKTSFLGIPGMIKNAIVAFRAFSVTLLTSPIGWIALAITAVVFLIYKYWKPITGFFRGVWQGLKEGLAPLKPVFNQLVKALQPIIKPIKAVIDWFKKLFKPVEDTGGAAEKMGVKFGKAIANIILKFVDLIKKVFEFGAKIGDMLSNGILSKLGKTKDAIGKHAQIIRDHLPHSPAKTGPLKDLHKLKISETIAANIKPMPIISAMHNALRPLLVGGVKRVSGFALAPSAANPLSAPLKTNVARGKNQNSGINITYSPVITISGSDSKDEFLKMLKRHKDEVVAIMKRENERRLRLAY